jgi:hypothetical protein
MNMKRRYSMFLRGQTYYSEDTTTGKQASLRTKDATVASRLLHAKNEAELQPAINLQSPALTFQPATRRFPAAPGNW